MSVILILIIASVLMATLFLFGFIWSVRSGQYEDTTTPSLRVLMEECDSKPAERASDSRPALTPTLKVGRVTPCAPGSDASDAGAHGVTRPTTAEPQVSWEKERREHLKCPNASQ